MAERGEPKMSRQEFSVAYDSTTEQVSHSIDVQELAPALLAFGRLIREANTEFNGKKSTAKVLVVSDFEAKCFSVNFEVVLGLYEQIKTFFGSDDLQTAKTILEMLGLLGVGSAGGTYTFLQYLKYKRGRKVSKTTTISDSDGTGHVEVQIEGEHNSVQVHNHVYNLSENPKALRATRDAFLPLGDEGFDIVRFKDGDIILEEIDSSGVENIVASCNVGIEAAKETEPEIEVTSAWLSVYSPVYDLSAPNWRFRLGKEVVYVDISGTSISADALKRGGAFADDAYQVKLEITTEVDAQGKRKEPKYKIEKVVRFIPATPGHQGALFSGDE